MDFHAILEKHILAYSYLRAAQLQKESAAAIDVMVADCTRTWACWTRSSLARASSLRPSAFVDEARRAQAQNNIHFDSLTRALKLSNELLVDANNGIKCSEEASRAQAAEERSTRATYMRAGDEQAQEAAMYHRKYEMAKRAVRQARADAAAKAHLLAERDMEIAALRAGLALVQQQQQQRPAPQQQPAPQRHAYVNTILNKNYVAPAKVAPKPTATPATTTKNEAAATTTTTALHRHTPLHASAARPPTMTGPQAKVKAEDKAEDKADDKFNAKATAKASALAARLLGSATTRSLELRRSDNTTKKEEDEKAVKTRYSAHSRQAPAPGLNVAHGRAHAQRRESPPATDAWPVRAPSVPRRGRPCIHLFLRLQLQHSAVAPSDKGIR